MRILKNLVGLGSSAGDAPRGSGRSSAAPCESDPARVGIVGERLASGPPMLPLPAEPSVIVLAGFAGTGKTTNLCRIAKGLGANTTQVGVIVNEIGGASTEVDLDQLTKDLASMGIDGCACCTSNQAVIDAVRSFHRQGKTLVLIEQSGLSRTQEFSNTLLAERIKGHTISLINPAQLGAYSSYLTRHIRGADSILLTHSTDSDLSRMQRIIAELREDLPAVSISVDGNLDQSFPEPLWQHLISKHSGYATTSESPEAEAERARALKAFCEVEIVLYPDCTVEQIQACLTTMQTSANGAVQVLRAKGVLDGKNVNFTPRSDGNFEITTRTRDFPSELFEGKNFLLIRALDPRLRFCTGHIASNIGVPHFSNDSVGAIAKIYPTNEWLQKRFDKWALNDPEKLDGPPVSLPPISFAGDSVLLELREVFAKLGAVRDSERQKSIGLGIQVLYTKFFEVREELFRLSNSNRLKVRKDAPQFYVDLAYSTLRIISDSVLGSNEVGGGLCQRVPFFAQKAAAILQYRPARMMMQNLARLETPVLEGRSPPNSIDLQWLTKIAKDGCTAQVVTQEEVELAARHLESIGGNEMASALRAGLN